MEKEVIIDETKANYFSFIIFFAAGLLFGVPFSLLWGKAHVVNSFKLFLSDYVTLGATLIGGIILHEALHGFTWALFCKRGLKSIQYGILWKALAPYAHCKEKLPINGYRLGGAMPGLVVGLLPGVLSLFTGSSWLLMTGIFFTGGAAGDILVLWHLRHFKSRIYVQDHPHKIGFIVSENS
jgi:hypothetical protein